MVTREQVDQEIEKTLDAFKDRLEKNVKNGKDFWTDEICNEEGLQSRCEGLSIFLLQDLDAPEKVQKYLPAEKIKEEINTIHKTVMDKGFIPAPYDFYKELVGNQIKPADFIDTVTFVLACMTRAMKILSRISRLEEDTAERIYQMIHKSIKWLIDTHIPKQGWSGFCNKTSPFIYSTWTATDCLEVFGILEEIAIDDMTKKLMDELNGKLGETKEWLSSFAGRQSHDEWQSDPAKIGGTELVISVYGLDALLNLEVHKDEPKLVINLLTALNKAWNDAERRFYRGEAHLLRARDEGEAADIKYEDDSGLLMGLRCFAKAGRVLRDELSRINLYDKITETLEEMFGQLKDPKDGFCNGEGLWVDCEKHFSIYMTQRAIEALIEYRKFLPPGQVDMSQIDRKIDELLRTVRKMGSDLNEIKDHFVLMKDVTKVVEKKGDDSNELKGLKELKGRTPKKE